MPTVPNWIAKGYAVSRLGTNSRAYPVKTWRATKTQVVVTLDGIAGAARFYLNDLTEVGHGSDGLRLVAPDDERVRNALGRRPLRAAVNDLLNVIGSTPLDPSAMDAEAMVVAIGRIQRAATKAMADLAGLL